MSQVVEYPMTRQGVRDLDRPRSAGRFGVNVGPGERAVSSVGGAALAGFGLAQDGLLGAVLVALGGALAYRGVTGHCSAYAMAGINTAR